MTERPTLICPSGKIIHATEDTARDHAATLRLTTGDHLVRPYRCGKGSEGWHYHVGHRPGSKRRRRR